MAAMTYADHAAQSGNWYDPRERKQVEQVMGSKGKLVKPSLLHARKLALYPGVTTILRESSAPALERWKIKQAILSALTLPRGADETDDCYLDRVLEDSEQQAQKAADAGTSIHAAVQEMFLTGKLTDKAQAGKVEAALACLEKCCGSQQWQSEQVAICPLGYGTKVDLFSPGWIIDWKTKDGNENELISLDTYESHWKQLAAGHRALGQMIDPLEECRAAIGYISRTHDAAVLVEVPQDKLSIGLAMFDCNLTHWKLRTGYDPSTGVSR